MAHNRPPLSPDIMNLIKRGSVFQRDHEPLLGDNYMEDRLETTQEDEVATDSTRQQRAIGITGLRLDRLKQRIFGDKS